MTTEMCTDHCQAVGFQYAATEFANECFCGNSINSSGGANKPADNASCNMPCDGGSGSYFDRMNCVTDDVVIVVL